MIKLKFVYGLLPSLVHYTDSVRDGFGGMAFGPYVKIRPKYINDRGLLEHELVHVKQWYRTLGTHGIWYWFSKSYKMKSELEAYATQAKYYTSDSINWMTDVIMSKYGLDNYTREYVIAELTRQLKL